MKGKMFGLITILVLGNMIVVGFAHTVQASTIDSYEVCFDLNGGDGDTPAKRMVTNGKTYGDLPAVTRVGYTFNGWYTDAINGKKITEETKVNINSQQTIYAQWTVIPAVPTTKKSYMVYFDAGIGTTNTKSKKVYEGEMYGDLPVPTCRGWIFGGWYTEQDCKTQILDTSIVLKQDITLYAFWIDNDNKIISVLPIQLNQSIDGKIEKGEAKWYMFDAPKDGLYMFSTSGNMDDFGELYSPNMSKRVAFNDDSGVGDNFAMDYYLSKGQKVYLKISGYANSTSGNYIISVTEKKYKVSLEKTKTVSIGKTVTLKASISNSYDKDIKIIWSSNNPKIAKVSDKGVVSGVKAGTTTITARTAQGEGMATCKITVKKVSVKSVILNKKKLSIKKGKKATLLIKILPKNATNQEVKWKSSDKKIAVVNKDGTVSAIKSGIAKIIAETKDGKKTATCKVIIK